MSQVVRQTLEVQVFEILRREIATGEIAGGTKLVQDEIAARMGTSRIPVRDALRRLAAEGLVEPDERGSYSVVEFGIDDIEEIYAMRQRLEGLATNIAASCLKPADIAELRRLTAAMKEAIASREYGRYVDINNAFHSLIYNATGRMRLVRTITGLWCGVPPLTPLSVQGQIDVSLAEHGRILDHLERGDAEAAEAAMIEHIGNAGERLIQSMREAELRSRSEPARAAR